MLAPYPLIYVRAQIIVDKSRELDFMDVTKIYVPSMGLLSIKCILPEVVSNLEIRGVLYAICGKRLTFLYTSPYEYNVSGPWVKYFCV